MATVGKEAERAELHKTIWRIANDLRGSVDGWDFKTYVLGTLFYRFISENLTAYLNEQERKAGSPDFDYASPQRRRGRARTAGDGRREGLLHPAPASSSRTSASGRATTRTSTRRSRRSSATSRAPRSARRARTTSRASSTTSTSTRASSGRRSPSATRSSSSCSTRSATSTWALRRQHDRRLRRRLRVPDDDVRLERRQVRRRVLHAAGGVGAARPDHGRRQDRGEQGLRPGLRLGVAAAEVREGARPRQRAAGVLRPGDQPHDLQPVPDQHVPARRQLREVRHRPRRHADRPAALGRRAVRGDRLQSALLDQVGRATRTRCSSTTRASRRPACSRRSRRPTSPSRCTC